MHKSRLPPMAGAAALLILTAPLALAADPAPVLAGLWEVNLQTSFAPRPESAATAPMQAPRRRVYRICIGPDRVREPMPPPPAALGAEMTIGRSGISGTYALPGADGQPRPVEFAYHRLDATLFEGSLDLQQPQRVARTQYMARRVAADCGALAPQAVSDTGEP